jgi:hypothetical protein
VSAPSLSSIRCAYCRSKIDGRPSVQSHGGDRGLFVVPTIAFEQLFAFLVLLDRRQWLWFAVTRNPTAEWLARQITEAFPWDSAPKYLIRDNDKAFGVAFKARVQAMGIRDRLTAATAIQRYTPPLLQCPILRLPS